MNTTRRGFFGFVTSLAAGVTAAVFGGPLTTIGTTSVGALSTEAYAQTIDMKSYIAWRAKWNKWTKDTNIYYYPVYKHRVNLKGSMNNA